MAKDLSEEKRNQGSSEMNTGAEHDQDRANEKNYRNIETSVNNPDYFDDDYESRQEDEITMEEPRTEKAGKTGKS